MKTIIKAVSVIALMTLLSGCIVAPGHGGYHHDRGWHGGGGWHNGWHHYHGRY